MGRVFRWEEVEEGGVPHMSCFGRADTLVRSELERMVGVTGAVLCGSVLTNSATPRSDIDCLVVYGNDHSASVASELERVRDLCFGSMNVPIGFVPLDAEAAALGLHTVHASFAIHLRRAVAQGGVILKNPLPDIKFPPLDTVADLLSYSAHKLSRLRKRQISWPLLSEAERCQLLQKALEAPVQVARKALHAKGVALPDDSRRAVVSAYLESASQECRPLFEQVVRLDDEYTFELGEQLRQRRRERYESMLREIKNQIPVSLEFIRLNALEFLR
jgi:hypothetical protein